MDADPPVMPRAPWEPATCAELEPPLMEREGHGSISIKSKTKKGGGITMSFSAVGLTKSKLDNEP